SITFDANAGTNATGGTSTDGYTFNGNTITFNTSAAGQNPFAIDIANNVTTGTGSTQTFNTNIVLSTADATFRSQQSLARMTFTGDINLGSRTLTINNTTGGSNNFNLQGVIINGDISNGNLTKSGSGTLQLTGNNSYANTTVSSGYVLVDTNTALGATTGTVTVNDPGQIQLRNGVTVQKTTLNLNSNSTGGGLGADGGTTNTFKGSVVLMAGNGGVALGAGFGAANASTRLVIDGVISGATSTLFINGSGTLEFKNDNTYTGQTNLNGNQGPSTLQINSKSGLGAGGAGNETFISSGNTVLLNFTGTLQDAGNTAEKFFLAGGGIGGLGALRLNGTNSVTVPGTITFIAGSPWNIGVDDVAGTLTLTGVIDSQGVNRTLTKVGAGTLIIGGTSSNTYLGGTIVNGGLLSVQNTSVSPLGLSTSTVTINSTGTLHVATGIVVPNPVALNADGTLQGTGTVNQVTSTGGTVSPGLGGIGTLTLSGAGGNSTLDGATLNIDLTSTPTTDLFKNNSNDLNLDGGILTVSATSTSSLGQIFTIITSGGTLTGIFDNLSEGATFAGANGRAYQINYDRVSATKTVKLTDRGAAGGVTATVTNGQLVIVGDITDNSIQIGEGLTANSLIVAGINGTTINGQSFMTFEKVKNGLSVTLLAGRDLLKLGDGVTRSNFKGTVTVSLDAGGEDDSLDINNVRFLGDASFDLGNGNQTVSMVDAFFKKQFTLLMGNGTSQVDLTSNQVRGTSTLNLGDGTNSLDLIDSQFKKDTQLVGGNNVDTVSMDSTRFKKSLQMLLNNGNDTFDAIDSIFGTLTDLNGGGGTDSIDAGLLSTPLGSSKGN
ncbi:MAG: autotransporter-associated beta strand repeat-containing protein, partial [Planctomycetaceae bacterium]|nr:autotransporter-associated beta strand repeat-containing protein [Planctomycetaceae bacterium]